MAGDVAFLNKTICYYRIREGSITNEQMLSKGSRSLDSLLVILKRYTDNDFTKKYFNNNKSLKKLWIVKIYLDALKEVKRQRENGFDNTDKIDLLNSLALKELGFRYYMPELIRKRRKFL